MRLYSVDALHFFAGIVMDADVCVEAAPILKWAIGKTRPFLRDYFSRKGWKVRGSPETTPGHPLRPASAAAHGPVLSTGRH